MPAVRRKKASGLVTLVWIVNAAGILALVSVLILYYSRQPALAAPAPIGPGQIAGAATTPTAWPTRFFLSTVTPNPRSTQIEDYASPTPFIFTSGPAPSVIGYSVLARPIGAYAFGQGENEYLIVAGIHGGYEGNTVDLANELVVYISQNPEIIPSGTKLYIIPDMNPDATARGRNADARVNANGVDLNRNFPSQNWVANWNHQNCWNDRPTTGGTYGGSEPETKTVISFIKAHHIIAMISYHSAALGVFPGGVEWEPASKRLAKALARAAGYPYPPIEIGCVYTGTLADWAVENGVYASVDMELANHRDPDFERNLRALRVLLGFSK
jgi:protein MpaA